MSGYRLRLTRDELEPQARLRTPLPPLNRVLYTLDGQLAIEAGVSRVSLNATRPGTAPARVPSPPGRRAPAS